MPMHESEHGIKTCITEKTGRLGYRVKERIDCESTWSAALEFHCRAALRKSRVPLYVVFSVCAIAAILGIIALVDGEPTIGFSLLGVALAVSIFSSAAAQGLGHHVTEISRLAVEYESTHWKYARLLARSDFELCSLGFPVQYRGVWIIGIRDDELPEPASFEIRAIIKPDSDSVPIDYMPAPIAKEEDFFDACDLIDRMHENGELLKVEDHFMLT